MNALEARAAKTYLRLRLRTDNETAAGFYERRGYLPSHESSATHVRRLAE